MGEEQQTGKWIKTSSIYKGGLPEYICSECGARLFNHFWHDYHNFCPNCGARMEDKE